MAFCQYGQGYEGNEGHGSHEGYEGHVQDCKGPLRQSRRLSWIQGEDRRWLASNRLGEEQERKDREQEAIRSSHEEVCLLRSQGLVYRCPEGKEDSRFEGLRRCQGG